MAPPLGSECFKWSTENTFALIKFRAANEAKFLKKKFATKVLWEQFVTQQGLEGQVTHKQVSKKWENLKKRYNDLRAPKSESGTESGELTASSWPFYMELARREPHSDVDGSTENTFALIKFRAANEAKFLKKKFATKVLWEQFVTQQGLEGQVTHKQVSKKWENLKKHYKDLTAPKSGSGTESGELTASSWPFYMELHDFLGGRPAVDPPVVVASFRPDEDPTAMLTISDVHSAPASPPSSRLASPAPSSASSLLTTPTPGKRKRKRAGIRELLDFLEAEASEEKQRYIEEKQRYIEEKQRYIASDAKMERLLSVLERIADRF